MFIKHVFIFTYLYTVIITGNVQESHNACTKPGAVKDPGDCKGFILCAEDKGELFLTDKIRCPEGHAFSDSLNTCTSAKEVPGCTDDHVMLPNRTRRATTQDNPVSCSEPGTYCENCDRLVVCGRINNKMSTVVNISCSSVDSNMACNKDMASCSTVKTAQCDSAAQTDAFRCLEPGFYPDPKDCSKYHICSENLDHYIGDCDERYDARRETCDIVENIDKSSPSRGRDTSSDNRDTEQSPGAPVKNDVDSFKSAECKKIVKQCTTENPFPVQFPHFPSYYVVCIPSVIGTVNVKLSYQYSVLKCQNGKIFNEKLKSCEVNCNGKKGRFEDEKDCHSYLECMPDTVNAGKFKIEKKTCPTSLAFDLTRKMCIPELLVKNCAKTSGSSSSGRSTAENPTPTISPTSTEFLCSREGRFQDPKNCRKYFECTKNTVGENTSYELSSETCPRYTYYNPRYGYCLPGRCA